MGANSPAPNPFAKPYARDETIKMERHESKSANKGNGLHGKVGSMLDYGDNLQEETKSEKSLAGGYSRDESVFGDEFAVPEMKQRPKRTSGKKGYPVERDLSSGYYDSGNGGEIIGEAESSALRARKLKQQKRRKQSTPSKQHYSEEDEEYLERANNFDLSRISERIGEEECSRFIESKEHFDQQVLEYIKTPLSSQEHELKK